MSKMTYEDFIDALKIIIKTQPEIEEPESKTFKEKVSEFFMEIVDTFRYIFSLMPLKDLWATVVSAFNFIKYVFSAQCYIDLKQKIENIFAKKEKESLTKEEFIKRGLKFKAALIETVDTVVFVIVMVIIIRFFVGEIRWIPSASMHPTLLEGDRIFVERYSRFNSTPNRGDIMVFYPPMEKLEKTPIKVFARLTGFFCKDIAYIKRVIGLPGEKFEVKFDMDGKGYIYINDKPLEEPYIQSVYEYPPCMEDMTFCGPLVIPEGQYMMLGDNRGNSLDGRYWGLLPKERFIGKAVFLFWPFNRMKSLRFKDK